MSDNINMANNSEAATTLAAGGTNPAQPQGSTMCCDINALWDAAISGLKITMDMDGLLDKDKVALVKAYIMDDATFRLQLLAQAFNIFWLIKILGFILASVFVMY